MMEHQKLMLSKKWEGEQKTGKKEKEENGEICFCVVLTKKILIF